MAYWIDRLGLGVVATVGVVLILVLVAVVVLLTRKPKAQIVAATVQLQRSSAPPATVLAAPPVAEARKAALPVAENFGSIYIDNGPLKGNRFPIPKQGLLIGRDPSRCSVVLSDETVSKEHAWVVPLNNEVSVIDRSSSNGTYVNSTDSPRISKMPLKAGDRIFIGRKNPTEITYFGA